MTVFKYPADDTSTEEYERVIRAKKAKLNKSRVVVFSITVFCFVLLTISFFIEKLMPVFLVCITFDFLLFKALGKVTVEHYTEIEADEDKMLIKSTNLATGNIEQFWIWYSDIQAAVMNKNLTAIKIVFDPNYESGKSIENIKGEVQFDGKPNICELSFDNYTFQQFFFLYIAPQFFKIRIPKVLKNDEYIINKFGYDDDYLNKII